jgi:hypothetical protein
MELGILMAMAVCPTLKNIDHQLLREYRKNSRINVSGSSISFSDMFLAFVIILVAIPLGYISVMAVIHFGWWGLIVAVIFLPTIIAAGLFVAALFQG